MLMTEFTGHHKLDCLVTRQTVDVCDMSLSLKIAQSRQFKCCVLNKDIQVTKVLLLLL